MRDDGNLAFHVGDDPKAVRRRWNALYDGLGIARDSIASCTQVHGTEIVLVEVGGHHGDQKADALISTRPGVGVGVFTADCVPVLILDEAQRFAAAVHCGWRGLQQNLIARTVARMSGELGTHTSHCLAWIGAAAGACSYEVGRDVAEQFDPRFARSSSQGRWLLDLAGIARGQLVDLGLRAERVTGSSLDTMTSPKCFSYRRERDAAGRMLSYAIWLE